VIARQIETLPAANRAGVHARQGVENGDVFDGRYRAPVARRAGRGVRRFVPGARFEILEIPKIRAAAQSAERKRRADGDDPLRAAYHFVRTERPPPALTLFPAKACVRAALPSFTAAGEQSVTSPFAHP
jgi:hypothetical protein